MSEKRPDIPAGGPDLMEVFRLACAQLDDSDLGVICEAPPRQTDGEEEPGFSLGWEGPGVTTRSSDDFTAVVSGMVESGTNLLAIPLWGRRSGARLERHEETVLEITPKQGRLAVLLPATSLYTARSREFRDLLLTTWTPRAIVEFTGVPGAHAQFMATLVVLERPDGSDSLTRFFRVPLQGDSQAVCRDLARLMRMSGGSTEHGYVCRGDLAGRDTWSFDGNDPRVAAEAAALRGFGGLALLAEYYDVVSGPRRSKDDGDFPARILTARGISREGGVEAEPVDEMWDSTDAFWRDLGPDLREGDLVLRNLWQPGHPLVVGEVRPEQLPACATRHVSVLRPKSEETRADSRFYMAYLRSSAAKVQLAALAQGMCLTRASLERLPVPVPDTPLRGAFADLDHAQRSLVAWTGEIGRLLTEAFERSSPVEARAHVIARGRLLRQRAEAAALLDDPAHQIATRYPYPVAIRWSVAANERGRGNDLEYVRKALDCFETLMAYTASIGVVLARARGMDVRALEDVRSNLSTGQGPTLGTWRAILQELGNSKKPRTGEPGSALMGVERFLVDGSPTAEASKYLADVRNDLSHARPPAPSKFASVAAAVEDCLAGVLDAASFLMDLVPVYVTDARWDALRGRARLEVQRLAGDRTEVPFEVLSYPDAAIEVRSLYILDEEGSLCLLRPNLLRERCPECQSLSTFHIDKLGDDGVWLKSLEDGHRMKYPDAEPFRQVGYLPWDR